MLEDKPCPVVSDPPVLDSYSKRNTYSSGQHKGRIAEGKSDCVLGKHSRKCKVERATTGFDTTNIRLDGEDEDRNPE